MGEEGAALLYVREENGHYYVDYRGKDADQLAETGVSGAIIANIIDDKRVVGESDRRELPPQGFPGAVSQGLWWIGYPGCQSK